MTRAIAIASMLGTSCVVVSPPSTAVESEGSSDATGDGLEPSAFPVWWAVTPASVEVPSGSDAIEIHRDSYVIADLSLGQTPASVADPEAKYDELELAVEALVPADATAGLGLIVNLYWEVPWCTVSEEDREAFAASPVGVGLDEDALAVAWEQAGATIHVGLIERARETRPQLQWGFAGLPRAEYFPNVSAEPQVVRDERECSVLDPSMAPVWDAVDVVVPIVRMWYTGLEADVLARNRLYVQRYIEGARLVGKPTIPLFEGRYVQSSPTDTNPYESLPILSDDVRVFLEASRLSGAEGFVYALDADSCWNFEEGCAAANPGAFEDLFASYWNDTMLAALRDLE
jgi:hypothetical protein